jgi:Mg/Co/Ni transporter MgtE
VESDLALSHEFIRSHPIDAATILEEIGIEDIIAFLMLTPPDLAAEILKLMDTSIATDCLQEMDVGPAGAIIEELPVEIAAVLLHRMERRSADLILREIEGETAGFLRELLSHPEGTAGSMMDPRVLTLPEDITVGEALERVRASAGRAMYYVYVLARNDVLVGVVTMRELMLATPDEPVSSLMERDVVSLSVRADRQTVAVHPGWLRVHALPVVTDGGIFVGAIRYDTFRHIEEGLGHASPSDRLRATGAALGEVYWLAAAGLVTCAGTALRLANQHET